MKPRTLAVRTAEVLLAKKALEVAVYNVARFTIVAEYFVIAGATSDTHRRALLESVEETLAPRGVRALRQEGVAVGGGWTAADFGGVILHIMSPRVRAEVAIEKLYAGARRLKVNDAQKNIKRKNNRKTRR